MNLKQKIKIALTYEPLVIGFSMLIFAILLVSPVFFIFSTKEEDTVKVTFTNKPICYEGVLIETDTLRLKDGEVLRLKESYIISEGTCKN